MLSSASGSGTGWRSCQGGGWSGPLAVPLPVTQSGGVFARSILLLFALGASPWALGGGLLPVGSEAVDVPALLQRVVARARAVATETNGGFYVFRKLAVTDTLDASGEIKRTREKVYEVTVRQGMTQNRLVAVDGRRLAGAESDALSEKERRWRETYSSRRGEEGGSRTERMDQIVNEKLFARFEFTAVGREVLRGRPCIALDFRPRSGDLPDERLMDRVLNLFRGRIWIDEEEDELARAEIATEGAMRVWGGMLGSLERFRLHVDRERSPYGVWFNRHAEIEIRARKLLTSFGMRVREVGSEFRPAT